MNKSGKQLTKAKSSPALTQIKGIGPGIADRLARLGINTIQHLLFHLPARYQDRTRIVPIGSLRPGDEVTFRGEVQLTEVKYGRKRMLLSRLSDGTGFITLRFFHFSKQQQAGLEKGTWLQCFGEIRGTAGQLEVIHPEYRYTEKETNAEYQDHLTPIYPVTEGLGQAKLRSYIDTALTNPVLFEQQLVELLPAEILEQKHFPALTDALRFVHHPPPETDTNELMQGTHPAQRRLAFEELLAQQLSLKQLREKYNTHVSPSLQANNALTQQLLQNLPFALTGAQQRVYNEISTDLEKSVPMQRLVQGDVGCGKTIVAALAALKAVESGYQVAVMAPTELLAEQHRINFSQWMSPLDVSVLWLSGKIKGKERTATLASIANGQGQIVIGTQALFQESVVFKNLGLVIIDEQHRFGVHQRLSLRDKGLDTTTGEQQFPHQLVMTATPIPRTLAQAAYADLDLSIIDELPPGRTPVETVVISEQRRDDVVARVHKACQEGRQVYWVCPLIEESESLQCQAAQDTADALDAALTDVRIGLVHGRLKPAEKDRVMSAFKSHEIDLLVATTVIEVGVDVPNASLMIIDNAERLGLSQLHQLRGRVGRGAKQSSCVLLYGAQLSRTAKERLTTLRETNDGFVIAQRDLEIRGPGELLGTRQTGLVNLRIADLQRDQSMLPEIALCAEKILHEYPQNVDAIIHRWLGESLRYGDV
ncbi:ATP-dependent DNA helicase RecG [Kaarinaea lacus]